MSHKKRKFAEDEERNLHHVFAAAAKVCTRSCSGENLSCSWRGSRQKLVILTAKHFASS